MKARGVRRDAGHKEIEAFFQQAVNVELHLKMDTAEVLGVCGPDDGVESGWLETRR